MLVHLYTVYTLTIFHYLFLSREDMIAIPDFDAGAMENWGLITYRETAMLYVPGVSSEYNKQRVTTVVTHELAHQVSIVRGYNKQRVTTVVTCTHA